MAMNWSTQAASISRRWGTSSPSHQHDPALAEEMPPPPEEFGTRYFLHVTFVLQFIFQIINAGIQHHSTPIYFIYIMSLHGPLLLFIVWVAQIFQQVMATKIFGLQEKSFDAILSPMGGLIMHETTSVAQDVKVSMMLPTGYLLLSLFWISLYAIFDRAEFDDTFTHCVDFDELGSIRGFFANVAVQAFFLCIYLVALHVVVPIFPLSGASFYAARLACIGLGVRRSAMIMDIAGFIISFILLGVGLQQTFFDDQNGIGVYVLFNALLMIAVELKRGLDPLDKHDLVTRRCYIEKEESGTTPAVSSASPEKEADITDATDSAPDALGEDDDMQELELV